VALRIKLCVEVDAWFQSCRVSGVVRFPGLFAPRASLKIDLSREAAESTEIN
jgi:hypothetical protein